MKIYIAGHDFEDALHVAGRYESKGHHVVSRWLKEPFLPTSDYTTEDRQRIAKMDFEDIAACDLLVLISGPAKYSGGKFVEAGIALGMGKRVAIIGRRENMLMWHPSIEVLEGVPNE